ncbi:MAG TPA: hypothetical protein ENJ23_03730 [Bacteroidetes bacterium]|nr:hypothetical protein [Bacteroidota bacterium]
MSQEAYKICPTCNFFCLAEEDKHYCPLCGQKLIAECPNCSAPISFPYSKYCEKCGARLREIGQGFKPISESGM